MTLRVCVIGDSNIAAVKLAWEHRNRLSWSSIRFYGAGSDSLRLLHACDGRLVTDDPHVAYSLRATSGTEKAEIDLAAYDLVWVHGLFRPSFAVLGWLWLDEFALANGQHFSSAIRSRMIAHEVHNGLLGRVLELVRSISDLPLIVSVQPYLSERVLGMCSVDPGKTFSRSSGRLGTAMADSVEAALSAVLKDYGAHLLAQPRDTISSLGLTLERFDRGSVRLTRDLDEPHPDDDVAHMNSEFGALLLDAAVHLGASVCNHAGGFTAMPQ